jgi:hypothetical protein
VCLLHVCLHISRTTCPSANSKIRFRCRASLWSVLTFALVFATQKA